MSNPIDVQWFTSDMAGAPALSGTAGALIAVLDACLLNGFGSVTLSSLVVSGGVATATKTGHGFLDHVVVLIEGSTPSGLNGKQRITWVDANTFTFDATGIADQTATGTITAKMAPAGWTKAYSGANKAAYSRSSVQSTAMLLRVDDSPTLYPTLTMYEAMSDVDTGTGASTTRYTAKSSTSNSTARAWRLFADDLAVYLFIKPDGIDWKSAFMFGDFPKYRTSDAFNCLLVAHNSASLYTDLRYLAGNNTGAEIARSYTQVGVAVTSGRYSHGCTFIGAGHLGLPNSADNAIHAYPILVCEGTTIARGEMPGMSCPIHSSQMADGVIIDKETRKMMFQMIYSSSYVALMDMTGPWR